MKEKRPLNPAEAWRKRQKQKSIKNKRAAKLERLTGIPVDRRDPYALIHEIQKYEILGTLRV
jgi:hypothetical protein